MDHNRTLKPDPLRIYRALAVAAANLPGAAAVMCRMAGPEALIVDTTVTDESRPGMAYCDPCLLDFRFEHAA